MSEQQLLMLLRVSPEQAALSSIWSIAGIQSTWSSKLFIYLRKSAQCTCDCCPYHGLHPGCMESTQPSVDSQHPPLVDAEAFPVLPKGSARVTYRALRTVLSLLLVIYFAPDLSRIMN